MRNYERDGLIPPAQRTDTGYRLYTPRHRAALGAYLTLVRAYGYPPANTIMRAVHAGDVDAALRTIDEGHAQLVRDRQTLDAVAATAGLLLRQADTGPDRPLPVGAVAHRLGVVPATLRKWERAGILVPPRDRATGHRTYRPADVRDAELAHLLRRGGYPLAHVATVLRHVRDAGGTEPLAASLADWRRRLTDRGRLMLSAAAALDAYLQLRPPAA